MGKIKIVVTNEFTGGKHVYSVDSIKEEFLHAALDKMVNENNRGCTRDDCFDCGRFCDEEFDCYEKLWGCEDWKKNFEKINKPKEETNDIKVFQVKDGDTILVNLKGHVSSSSLASFRQKMKGLFPNNNLMVTAGLDGMDVMVFANKGENK